MSTAESFPYTDRNPASGGVDLMPDLPIVLRHQGQTLSAIGLVDSGASINVLLYSLGTQLGFDWKAQKSPITLAGTLAGVAARGIVVEAIVGHFPRQDWRLHGHSPIKSRSCSVSAISLKCSTWCFRARNGFSRFACRRREIHKRGPYDSATSRTLEPQRS